MRVKPDISPELELRVEAGFNLLTEKLGPDWVNEINCEILDLANCQTCVLGQLAPMLVEKFSPSLEAHRLVDDGYDYFNATEVLKLHDSIPDNDLGDSSYASYYGFQATDWDKYSDLTAAWEWRLDCELENDPSLG